jgi:hypothetical protein
LLDEGLAYGRAHGFERGTAHFLVNFRMYLEYGRGEWEAALATARELEASSSPAIIANGLRVRAWIAAARDGPRTALPVYERLRELRDPVLLGRILQAIDLARGLAAAGDQNGARASFARLDDLVRDVPAASGLDTPRSLAFRGPGTQPLIIAAALTAERRWLDEVADALRQPTPMHRSGLHLVSAARAALDGDAAETARLVIAAREALDRVGFLASWMDVAAALRATLRAKDVALGAEWEPIIAELRSFATLTRATARLEELAA